MVGALHFRVWLSPVRQESPSHWAHAYSTHRSMAPSRHVVVPMPAESLYTETTHDRHTRRVRVRDTTHTCAALDAALTHPHTTW